MKSYIIFLILIALTFALIMNYQVVRHENAHKQIQLYYGCKEVYINYTGLFSGKSQCLNGTYRNVDMEYQLHAFNEIIGYNNTGIILAIMGALVLLTFYLEVRK